MQKMIAWMNGERASRVTAAWRADCSATLCRTEIRAHRCADGSARRPARRSSAVINFFDNLLPDSPLIRDRIVARYQIKSRQPFDLFSMVAPTLSRPTSCNRSNGWRDFIW
jgi:serine/threonine-protein kinase HipA